MTNQRSRSRSSSSNARRSLPRKSYSSYSSESTVVVPMYPETKDKDGVLDAATFAAAVATTAVGAVAVAVACGRTTCSAV